MVELMVAEKAVKWVKYWADAKASMKVVMMEKHWAVPKDDSKEHRRDVLKAAN